MTNDQPKYAVYYDKTSGLRVIFKLGHINHPKRYRAVKQSSPFSTVYKDNTMKYNFLKVYHIRGKVFFTDDCEQAYKIYNSSKYNAER